MKESAHINCFGMAHFIFLKVSLISFLRNIYYPSTDQHSDFLKINNIN